MGARSADATVAAPSPLFPHVSRCRAEVGWTAAARRWARPDMPEPTGTP